jgi:alpha-beta hydrolase superfamily lysophospholipase
MSQTTPPTGPLTVVLVHGAYADASSWTGVIERLQQAGVQVTAPANPLRGIASDSAYLVSFLNQISGPVLSSVRWPSAPGRRSRRSRAPM